MPTTNRIGLAVGLQKSTAEIKMLKSEYITISPTHSCFNTSRTLLLDRAVVKAPKFSHTTPSPILKSLHWLKVNERIEYKILSLT